MQATARTSPSSSTSTAARPGWSRSRTSSRRSSARSPTSTTSRRPPIERLDDDTARVTARLLGRGSRRLVRRGAARPGRRRDGRRAARRALGRVPIPGATARVNGLELVAEGAGGRRNRIDTVLVRRLPKDDDTPSRKSRWRAREPRCPSRTASSSRWPGRPELGPVAHRARPCGTRTAVPTWPWRRPGFVTAHRPAVGRGDGGVVRCVGVSGCRRGRCGSRCGARTTRAA